MVFLADRLSHTSSEVMKATKAELLERCSLQFLRDLASRIGTLPRNHWIPSKRKLITVLSRKFRKTEINSVFRSYLLCLEPQEIVDSLLPSKIEELVNAVMRFLGCDGYFREVAVGRLRCDLVGIRGPDVLAIEIKSARDKLRDALRQVKYYKLWAREVYLAYDYAHASEVAKLPFRQLGVGMLEISDSCFVNLKWRPSPNIINSRTLLSLFTTEYLRTIARAHKTSIGNKNEMVNSLSKILDETQLAEFLVSYFKTRAKVSRETVANACDQTWRICPLEHS